MKEGIFRGGSTSKLGVGVRNFLKIGAGGWTFSKLPGC